MRFDVYIAGMIPTETKEQNCRGEITVVAPVISTACDRVGPRSSSKAKGNELQEKSG